MYLVLQIKHKNIEKERQHYKTSVTPFSNLRDYLKQIVLQSFVSDGCIFPTFLGIAVMIDIIELIAYKASGNYSCNTGSMTVVQQDQSAFRQIRRGCSCQRPKSNLRKEVRQFFDVRIFVRKRETVNFTHGVVTSLKDYNNIISYYVKLVKFNELSKLFAFCVLHLFLQYLDVCHITFYLFQDQVQV